ncbi:GNAT family N-acetyltransferase [Aureibacillus halotolerans]|uniref:Putative acetyltransferase n=1 Tax=Aureibacillus halotolerans TaxID=1508390 RepID=A0A4R6U8F3_9BACI|nr:GNAT family N-acetyltransferase [Aureibacillus halotolerans]TDQ40895.1 putative acetyltransferase [Aureibacillus halotolerans]
MAKLQLITPNVAYEQDYKAFYQDWQDSGRAIIPSVAKDLPADFAGYVQRLNDNAQGIGLEEGIVPNSTFWLVNEENNEVLGAVNIRHQLTPYLERVGGHIGFGLRPTARGKGYAKTMLALSLKEAKSLELEKVLITCDVDNVTSEKTILKNGGRRSTDEQTEEGIIVHRFWIDL